MLLSAVSIRDSCGTWVTVPISFILYPIVAVRIDSVSTRSREVIGSGNLQCSPGPVCSWNEPNNLITPCSLGLTEYIPVASQIIAITAIITSQKENPRPNTDLNNPEKESKNLPPSNEGPFPPRTI